LNLQGDLLVLALPRGGAPVAYAVAIKLRAPLDVLLVRKVGLPDYPELAMGAVASGSDPILNQALIGQLRLSDRAVLEAVDREHVELKRQEKLYRGQRPPVEIAGRTVIAVDDGLGTGATMTAALQAVSAQRPRELIAAVPVGAPETCHALERVADRVVCAAEPSEFVTVGAWYEDFSQVPDEEVRDLLALAEAKRKAQYS
jgi:putative phosphoribosyl transferase